MRFYCARVECFDKANMQRVLSSEGNSCFNLTCARSMRLNVECACVAANSVPLSAPPLCADCRPAATETFTAAMRLYDAVLILHDGGVCNRRVRRVRPHRSGECGA